MIVNHISPAGKRHNRIAHLQTTCCYKVTKSQHLFYAQGHKMPQSKHNIMPKVTKCHQADTILCPRSQNATKQTQYYAQGHQMPPSRHNIMPKVTKCHQADTILCTCSQSPPSPPLFAQPNLQFYFAVPTFKKIADKKYPTSLQVSCSHLSCVVHLPRIFMEKSYDWHTFWVYFFPPTACIAVCT